MHRRGLVPIADVVLSVNKEVKEMSCILRSSTMVRGPSTVAGRLIILENRTEFHEIRKLLYYKRHRTTTMLKSDPISLELYLTDVQNKMLYTETYSW